MGATSIWSRRNLKCFGQSKTAELVCSAVCRANCCPIMQQQFSGVRRRHVHRHRRLRVHRRHLGLRAQRARARLFRAKQEPGNAWLVLRVEHCYVTPERCRGIGRRWHDRTRDQVRRDNFLRLRSQSGDCPSRGCSPILPMGPCPEKCRCRSIPDRSSHRARRRTAHSRSSRRSRLVERRC